jgi:DNA-binding GntR family transcriptional regulator
VLLGLWLGLARQLSVVWGLGHDARPTPQVVVEHRAILDRLAEGDAAGALAALDAHLAWHRELDFEMAVEAKRITRKG